MEMSRDFGGRRTGSETADPRIDRLRRLLIALAGAVTLFAVLHHADHVIRGELVLSYRLDENWNHSGWPFQSPITPFTASLLVYLALVPGIVFTVRGRLWAGYWLAASLVLGAVIVLVHFAPGPKTETPAVIFATYEQSGGSALAGVLALIDVFAIVAGLLALLVVAVRARVVSGRW